MAARLYLASVKGFRVKDLSIPFFSFLVFLTAITASALALRDRTAQDILAYLTFVFIVVYTVHRR